MVREVVVLVCYMVKFAGKFGGGLNPLEYSHDIIVFGSSQNALVLLGEHQDGSFVIAEYPLSMHWLEDIRRIPPQLIAVRELSASLVVLHGSYWLLEKVLRTLPEALFWNDCSEGPKLRPICVAPASCYVNRPCHKPLDLHGLCN